MAVAFGYWKITSRQSASSWLVAWLVGPSGAEETPELLDDLASEYFADGQADKSRELLERSLELDPEQPEVRRLLEEMLAPGLH